MSKIWTLRTLENTNFKKRFKNPIKKYTTVTLILLLAISILTLECTKEVKEKPGLSHTALEHYTLGIYYEQEGNDSLAILELEQALIINSNNPEILSSLAFALAKIGKYTKAEEYAELAIKNGAKDKDLYIILGNKAKEERNVNKAISFYKKALSDTTNYFLVLNLAQLMRETNMTDGAILLLQALKRRYPFDLRVHTQLGDLYGRLNKLSLATQEFTEALAIDSLYYPAWLGLGIIYEIKKNPDSSIIFYKKASLLDPENLNLKKRIVEFDLMKGNWHEARDLALEILKDSPTENNVRKQLAYAYYKLKNKENALKQYLLLSGLLPKDAGVHHFLGRLYYENNEMKKAKSEFSYSLKLNPDFSPNLEYLFFIGIRENDEKSSLPLFLELEQKGMKPEDIYFSAGTHFYDEKQYETSRTFLHKTVDENSNYVRAWYTLGFVFEKLDDIDSAEYAYRRVLDLDTLSANTYNALGYLFAEHNKNLKEAEMLINKAIALDSLNGYYIDSLGWLYFRLGSLNRAKEVLIKAIKYAQDPIIFEHLGDVYEKLGDREKATEMWQKSLELDPENEEVKKKLK